MGVNILSQLENTEQNRLQQKLLNELLYHMNEIAKIKKRLEAIINPACAEKRLDASRTRRTGILPREFT